MKHPINWIHKWNLKLVYNDIPNSSFEKLLGKDNLISIHQRSLQLLATKIFNSKNGIAYEPLGKIFQFVKKPRN